MVLLMVSLSSQVLAGEVTIEFNSNPIYAVQTVASGKVREELPNLGIVLDAFSIRIKDSYKKPLVIESIRMGLARKDAETGIWSIERYSGKYDLGVSLKPGEGRVLDNFRTVVPIDGIDSLNEYWLVIDVETDTRHHHYSHSNLKDLKGVLTFTQ